MLQRTGYRFVNESEGTLRRNLRGSLRTNLDDSSLFSIIPDSLTRLTELFFAPLLNRSLWQGLFLRRGCSQAYPG